MIDGLCYMYKINTARGYLFRTSAGLYLGMLTISVHAIVATPLLETQGFTEVDKQVAIARVLASQLLLLS